MKNKTSESYKKLSDLKWLPVALSAAGAIAFAQYFNLLTSNIFILIFAFMMYPIFKARYSDDNGFSKASLICSVVFSLFTVGSSFLSYETTFEKNDTYASHIPAIIMFIFFYEALTFLLYKRLDSVELTENGAEPEMKNKLKVFFGSMAVLLICWLPSFLYLYPGTVTEDSLWQLQQAAGQTPLSNHHPILHTLIIKLIYSVGQWLFNDDTKAVALYSVVQQIFLSACFAYFIETLYKFRAKKVVLVLALLSYIIPLYHSMYSVTMWKDIPFGGIMLVLSTLIWRLLRKEDKFHLSICEGIMLFVFSVGMCLMRSNGLYAFFLLIIAAVVIFFRRNKLTPLIMCSALCLSLVIKGPIYKAMNVKPVDLVESLSIPVQQIAAVIADNKPLTTEQEELLSQVIELEKVPEAYIVYISDPIKNLIRETDNQEYIHNHKSEFIKLYIQLGLTYPDVYFEAYLDQTGGFWYPDEQYWVTADVALTEGFDIRKQSKLGGLTEFFYFFSGAYIETPFLGLLWSIGAAVWAYVFMFGAAMRRCKKSMVLVFIPLLGVYLTLLIATPVYSEFRYLYGIFTTMPLFCTVPFMGNAKHNIVITDK